MKTINRTIATTLVTVTVFDFDPSTGCSVPRDPFVIKLDGELKTADAVRTAATKVLGKTALFRVDAVRCHYITYSMPVEKFCNLASFGEPVIEIVEI